jgi:hypothetical protein
MFWSCPELRLNSAEVGFEGPWNDNTSRAKSICPEILVGKGKK